MTKRLGGMLLAMAVLFSACGSEDNGGVIEQGQESTTAGHNAADVEFAQMMIPHHQQAIEMAELVPDRAESAEVKELAEQIKDAQAPEIETMTGWLEDWDEPVDGGMHSDMGGMDGMQGMMSEEEMTSLAAASGAEFDEMFLTMMRAHHVGAVVMAEKELEAGEFPEAKELAQTIIETQEAEIAEIDRLLAS